MKKKWLTASSLVAVSALSILGTKAYLTDADKADDTMVIGNIEIDQIEYGIKAKKTENGSNFANLTSLKTQEHILPVTGNWSEMKNTTLKLDTKDLATGINLLKMDGVQDKVVFVENKGDNSVYYRTIIAVECPEGLEKKVHINVNNAQNLHWQDADKAEGITPIYPTINGVRYAMYTVVDTEELKGKETSKPSLLQVYLDSSTTNEDVAKLKGELNVLVATQATQADTDKGSYQTLKESFGEISENSHPWENSNKISTMQTDLASGKDIIMGENIEGTAKFNNTVSRTSLLFQTAGGIIDGNGHILRANDAQGTNDSTIYTTGGTIKNVSIRGGFRGIIIDNPTQDMIIDNVNFDTTYTLHAGKTTGEVERTKLTVTNSQLNGWTSYDFFTLVTFEKCNFGINTESRTNGGTEYYQGVLRPYDNTVIKNSDFDEEYKIYTDKLPEGAKITLENCTINGDQMTEKRLKAILQNPSDYNTKVILK